MLLGEEMLLGSIKSIPTIETERIDEVCFFFFYRNEKMPKISLKDWSSNSKLKDDILRHLDSLGPRKPNSPIRCSTPKP